MAERALSIEPFAAPTREASARPQAGFRRLTITDFRSHAGLDLSLDGRPVVFVGRNGAGKTNILEALSMFGPGRGLRGAAPAELPRLGGAGGWAASALLAANGDERQIGVGAQADAPTRRVCRIDGAPASGPSAFCPLVRFIWLTPAQDRLFAEGASERRRFLDRLAVSHDPSHAVSAGGYDLAMRQRQRLLDAGNRDDRWLSALEWRMAESGVALAAGRRDVVGAIAAAEFSAEARFPASDLTLCGEIEEALDRVPAAEAEEIFAARLKAGRAADAAAGRALIGPHRSDMRATRRDNGRPAHLCSTGEQKALLIGLVLANARALALKSRFSAQESAPLVLLLDEAAAHLDDRRRVALFDMLAFLKFQVFMTGTDRSLFDDWGARAQAFEIGERGAAPFILE